MKKAILPLMVLALSLISCQQQDELIQTTESNSIQAGVEAEDIYVCSANFYDIQYDDALAPEIKSVLLVSLSRLIFSIYIL